MYTLYCSQKGCEFEIEDDGNVPENCPVCGNPFIEHPNPDTLHAVAETETIEETDTENEPIDDGELTEDDESEPEKPQVKKKIKGKFKPKK